MYMTWIMGCVGIGPLNYIKMRINMRDDIVTVICLGPLMVYVIF